MARTEGRGVQRNSSLTSTDERAWGIESLGILSNYFGVEDPATFEPLDRELDMTHALGSITIRGILDRIEERPEGLVITDYKTGKAPPERYALPAFFALKIYALLIRERLGRTPVALRLAVPQRPHGGTSSRSSTLSSMPWSDNSTLSGTRSIELSQTETSRHAPAGSAIGASTRTSAPPFATEPATAELELSAS